MNNHARFAIIFAVVVFSGLTTLWVLGHQQELEQNSMIYQSQWCNSNPQDCRRLQGSQSFTTQQEAVQVIYKKEPNTPEQAQE